jgi:hypothetical protein
MASKYLFFGMGKKVMCIPEIGASKKNACPIRCLVMRIFQARFHRM